MKHHDWEMLELLLHKVQESAHVAYAPREYVAELVEDRQAAGRAVGGNLDQLKMQAADYESLLFNNGFIESRPEDQGGNGENFVLTPRGVRLLELINSSLPAHLQYRQMLDAQGETALEPGVFDHIAAQAARA
ncbi:transcriptional regulator [Pseudomonas sp. BN414]|uniref:transcriptional regulator n=1 Tax=Pseudomonas sp. BN414 TaxID=2567888 RepID=UPI002453B97A|nr:transcriptional regulator [Pseudomonas sp. BN414]MDH4567155.1 transcriptional regulator [Pseudomonas sp. BN414]